MESDDKTLSIVIDRPALERVTKKDGISSDVKVDKKKKRPQELRRLLTRLSFLFIVILPTLFAAIYYTVVASDQYAVVIRFTVRSSSSMGGGSELLGMFTGVSTAGSVTTDTYILIDYIHSRQLLDKLQKNIDLREIYGGNKADMMSAFQADGTIEEFVEYWRKMVSINYDSASHIVVLEVKAFSAADAKLVSEAIIAQSELLVNDLSAQSRNDAVKNARQEVSQMEERLKVNRTALRAFREIQQDLDPTKTAEAKLMLIAKLESELSTMRSKLASLRKFMNKDSPRVIVLESKIEATTAQISKHRGGLGGKDLGEGKSGSTFSKRLQNYEILLVEKEFSEKAYISALTSLERARIDADRQQRYLATFIQPSLPEEALYPKRFLSIITIFIIAMILWAVGTLVIYSVRDHTT